MSRGAAVVARTPPHSRNVRSGGRSRARTRARIRGQRAARRLRDLRDRDLSRVGVARPNYGARRPRTAASRSRRHGDTSDEKPYVRVRRRGTMENGSAAPVGPAGTPTRPSSPTRAVAAGDEREQRGPGLSLIVQFARALSLGVLRAGLDPPPRLPQRSADGAAPGRARLRAAGRSRGPPPPVPSSRRRTRRLQAPSCSPSSTSRAPSPPTRRCRRTAGPSSRAVMRRAGRPVTRSSSSGIDDQGSVHVTASTSAPASPMPRWRASSRRSITRSRRRRSRLARGALARRRRVGAWRPRVRDAVLSGPERYESCRARAPRRRTRRARRAARASARRPRGGDRRTRRRRGDRRGGPTRPGSHAP